jgi:hypothetical protein
VLPVKDSNGPLTAEAVRAAFAQGLSPTSAALLLRARDAGVEWEAATQAAAAGLAAQQGTPIQPDAQPRRASTLVLVLSGVIAYVALRPLLGLGHELAVAGLASVFHMAVATGAWQPIVQLLGLDPIYAGAAIRALGGVQVDGLALAGPLGEYLSGAVPAVFLPPDRVANGAGISMVASAGAPAIGRGMAAFGADVVWLAIGLWVFWRWRRTSWRVALIGLLIQAQIAVNHLLDAQVGLADIYASGLPFAIAVAAPDAGWLTGDLGRLSSDVRDVLVGLGLVAVGYMSAVLLVVLAQRANRRRHAGGTVRSETVGCQPRNRWATALLSVCLAVATAWSPIGALAFGESNWQATAGGRVHSSRSGARIGGLSNTRRLEGATRVAVTPGSAGGWNYLVDGIPDTIRGVGYNPQYAGLSRAERAALYERDFSHMQRLGINTIEGWFEGQFDSVTLDNAARNGIGVLMPFELNQDWDYTDPQVRAAILDQLSAYVERYKLHPAVRMWAPGNENLHRILYPHWMSQENVPAARARAEAFAAFLPELVDRIHAVDPDHPVVYRDAEDVYLSWITNAFAQTGGDRPWLVYGANVYSAARLQQVISQWPAQWPGRPLLISEFAPGGVGPAERPLGFQQQWAVIQSRADIVLGGLAYTWATNGPEDLDRVFGLVDANGIPADGALAALSSAYMADGTVAEQPGANR